MAEKLSKVRRLIALGAVSLVAVAAGTFINNTQQKNTIQTNLETKSDRSEEVSKEKQAVKQEKANVSDLAKEVVDQTSKQATDKQVNQDAQTSANTNHTQEAVAPASDNGQSYVVDNGYTQGAGQSAAPVEQPVEQPQAQEAPTSGGPSFNPNIDPNLYQYKQWTDADADAALNDPNNYLDMGDGTRVYRGPGGAGIASFDK